jgi:hypothetical protein
MTVMDKANSHGFAMNCSMNSERERELEWTKAQFLKATSISLSEENSTNIKAAAKNLVVSVALLLF